MNFNFDAIVDRRDTDSYKWNKYKGRDIPRITTTGIWYLQPRKRGAGIVGMIDYISPRGYYGVMPWMPWE